MAAQPNEVRRSNFFISQSPSDDEEFPYWTPTDYLERKFARTNAQVWELVRSRQCVDTYTRNPALDRKLMEAVEMFGSEPENLQRTATKRSGDITVYSLLAQRCWRDVSKHIGTGVTPRQCEERYLQLIAASKRFDEQNIENGLAKVPLRSQQPYIVPTMPRNKTRATKSISDSNFDSINDLVQQDMHSSQRTYKGPNLHKRKRHYQGTASSVPFDEYDMELDDDDARELTKLKKQYARLAQTQDVPIQPAPAKFTKQVTEVAKVRPARPVDNVNIYKKHYIADVLTHTLLSPKRTSAIAKQSTTSMNTATTANAAPKRKYNVNKYKGKAFTRRKDAADSDFESYDSWKSDDLRTDDSAFDTSSSSDYYSSDDNAKLVSSVSSSNKNTSTESVADASTSTGQEIASTVGDVLASIVSKIESAFPVTTNAGTGGKSTPILAILPAAEPTVVDEGNDLSDSDLESAYSSSSSRAGDANHYHNSNIMYNYEFFEEHSADSSDLDDIGSVESLCSVSSNSTTTDYTPFIDPAIFKYDDTDFYANETAMNSTLDNTVQNRNVGAVQQSLTEKSDNVADILAEIVDTIVARNRPSPIVTTMNRKLPTCTPKTVRHSNVTTTSAPTTHPKLFKNNHETTPAAPIFTLPPLPPADEALLKSLLPTRRYRKKDINWKFLALLVDRKSSEIRAYAAQWRYEKRVELLNKLITLREHSTKKKSRRKVRTVRRPKKTENPKKITPSNPSKPPGEKKSTVKAGSSTLTLPAALVNNSPSKTSSSGDNPTNSATLTLHEMPPPSLHPVFDHTLLRAFLNVPGAARSAVGTGGTAVDGDEVRAEFHTEPVEHNSQKDDHKGSESSDIVGDGDRIDTTNIDDSSEAMDVHKSDNGPDAIKSATIIPKETNNTTVTIDTTTTTTANVNTDPVSRELISETLNISENEIEVAEILTQSRGSAERTDSLPLALHNQNVLPLEEVPTAVVTSVASSIPAVPISTIAATDSTQEKPSENGHIAAPDDATDLQLVKSMLLATTCNKSWAEVSKMTNLSEQTAAYCLQRYQQIQQHFPQYIDLVAVKVYLSNKVKRDTTLVEAMQKQNELTEQEQQLLHAVYLCHTGQLPILHAYLTNPLFNQVGVLCGTLCNWQYDAISKYLRWGRAHCQSRYAKLVREYKQKYPNASISAAPAATATTADSAGSVPANVDFATAASLLSAPSSHFFSSTNNTATTTAVPEAVSTTVTPGGDTNNPVQRPPSPLPRLPVPHFTAEKESLLLDLVTRSSSKLTPFVLTHARSLSKHDRAKYFLDWLGEDKWSAIAVYVGMGRRSCIDKFYTIYQAKRLAEMEKKASAQQPTPAAVIQSVYSMNNNGVSAQRSTGSSAALTSKPVLNTKGIANEKSALKSVSTTPRVDLPYRHEGLYYNEFSYPWSGSHVVNARELMVANCKFMQMELWVAADARVFRAQALYAAVLESMKLGESLDAERKQVLRTMLETHFSNAMPTRSFYFEGRNRSEDDWLVRLVWVQAASAAKKTAPSKPPMTAITSDTAILANTVEPTRTTTSATTTASTAASPIAEPTISISTAAASSTSSVAASIIPFDPTNPITAVRRIITPSQWDFIALHLDRSAEWCQNRYFLLLQANLSMTSPKITSQKLIFEYHSLKIAADTVASVSTSVTKKPRLKAVLNTVLSESQSRTQPQASGQNTTSTTGTSNASASVPGSTILPSATVGVKRKKNSDATSTKTKIQKAVYPETSGPSGAHPMVTNTSQNSMSGVQSTSAYSSSADPARDTMPSNHAFSSGFHHHTSAGSNSTQSNPMANNRTGVTMGIMASIPTMAEYEISSNNGSNDS